VKTSYLGHTLCQNQICVKFRFTVMVKDA